VTLDNWIALAGVAVATTGFLLVLWQVRQLERSLRSAAQSAVYDHAITLRSQLLARPDLRAFLMEGADIDETHEDFPHVKTLAEMLLNYLEHLAVQRENLGGENWAAWKGYVQASLEGSPLAGRLLEENRLRYARSLHVAAGR